MCGLSVNGHAHRGPLLSQGGFSLAATAPRPGHFYKDLASIQRGGRGLQATPRCSLVRSGDPAACSTVLICSSRCNSSYSQVSMRRQI